MQGQRAREELVQKDVVSCEETQDTLLCVCAESGARAACVSVVLVLCFYRSRESTFIVSVLRNLTFPNRMLLLRFVRKAWQPFELDNDGVLKYVYY